MGGVTLSLSSTSPHAVTDARAMLCIRSVCIPRCYTYIPHIRTYGGRVLKLLFAVYYGGGGETITTRLLLHRFTHTQRRRPRTPDKYVSRVTCTLSMMPQIVPIYLFEEKKKKVHQRGTHQGLVHTTHDAGSYTHYYNFLRVISL